MGGHQMQWGVDRIGCNGRAQNGTGWMGQSAIVKCQASKFKPARVARIARVVGWVDDD
jgi:hypothetical protein